jgi:unsaturated rhamnogalacturonyl hydrolase
MTMAATFLFAAETKPVFLYSRYYNAKGENRYEPDAAFKEVLTRLKQEFDVRVHDRPLTPETLKDVRVVLIANPSDKAASNNPAPAHISAKDIETLTAWVRAGGGLIVSGNQEDHNLEIEDINKLMSRFGLQFTNVYTDFKPITVPKSAPIIGGLRWAFFSGNQLKLDSALEPRPRIVVTNDASAPIKGTRNPPGVLMAVAETGRGRVVAFTETGWLTTTALKGEETAGTRIADQDNWEIFRRLGKWAAGESR